jgi:hypothetical protein
VNSELERVWKGAVIPKFDALSLHLPGGTEVSHDKPQSAETVFGPRYEGGTSGIRSRTASGRPRRSLPGLRWAIALSCLRRLQKNKSMGIFLQYLTLAIFRHVNCHYNLMALRFLVSWYSFTTSHTLQHSWGRDICMIHAVGFVAGSFYEPSSSQTNLRARISGTYD